MKAFICDQCKTQAAPRDTTYDLPPQGWFTLDHNRHFCSAVCLVRRARELETAERLKNEPTVQAAVEDVHA